MRVGVGVNQREREGGEECTREEGTIERGGGKAQMEGQPESKKDKGRRAI